MSDDGCTYDIVEREPRKCPCGKELCRPGQRNGLACRAAAGRKYRRISKQRRQQEHIAYLAKIASTSKAAR